MPPTMAIWLMDTRRPRRCAGAISAIYMGVDMEAMPMPMPPSQRNRMKVQMSRGKEVPMAEIRKSVAAMSKAFLRPNRSEMGPTIRTPPLVRLLLDCGSVDTPPQVIGLNAHFLSCVKD